MVSPTKAIDGAARRRQRGFTYLMLLLWVAIAGVMLAALGTSWSLMARREREAQWLWCGEQFRRALTSYAQAGASLQSANTANSAVNNTSNAASPAPAMGFDLSNAALTGSPAGAANTAGARVARRGAADAGATPADTPVADTNVAGASPGAAATGSGPFELQDLLEDRRSGKLVRHLRQIYRDPLTGSTEWGLQRGPDGRITGVYSRSDAVPLRLSLGVTHYRELVFGAMAASAAAPTTPASAASDAAAGGDASVPVRRRRVGL